jgi:electron transport complex protein RnfB
MAQRLPQNPDSPAARVNALLPQSQCGQCGYPGCRPYAEAIVKGSADINQCAPGGDALVSALARLLGREATRLDPRYGKQEPPAVAIIDEDVCIGCAICIAACPVDAIIGAANFSHTVLSDACTGCKLCVAPCPVDCISLVPLRQADAA